MTNIINYLYNLNIIEEVNYNNYTIYRTTKSSYYLEKISDVSSFNKIYGYCEYLNKFAFFSFNAVINIYNSILSKIENDIYVLVNIGNDYEKKVDFIDMIDFYNRSYKILQNNTEYRNNWEYLWENKINYLYNHFKNNEFNNNNISELFFYYLSIAESALLYVKDIKYNLRTNNNLSISHRRVLSNCDRFSFYNPVFFIVDLKIRDIASYIKSAYYSGEDYENDLVYYLKTNFIDTYNASMLYARLIYPSYFFDCYESGNLHLNINKFVNTQDYEQFLKKTYEIINSYVHINNIE